uniref:NAD-dependent epimerase/dehydratase domain-containing protein n=1 Tax=Polytomella parva TaxID=51329 RepID=A0A7S0UPC3_9CHLO|mmetsp:Transcript_11193/g.20263  ORF Transcript_11193/g.20263 Transcript_11193/m.20263 type:complete len:336 (+) Transcript_11193:102-1109(+)
MKVLVTGGSGYVGQHLVKELSEKHKVSYTYANHPLCDIENVERYKVDFLTGEGFDECFANQKYDAIVNCAALAQPIICAENPDTARQLNVPRYLLTSLRKHLGLASQPVLSSSPSPSRTSSPPLIIHLSTDQIYPDHHPLWTEEDKPEPVNVYGETKLMAESCLDELWPREEGLACVILRCSLIVGPPPPYGIGKSTFVQFIEKSTTSEENPGVFLTDEYRNPVLVYDIVDVCRTLLEWRKKDEEENGAPSKKLPYRVYNFGGPDRLNRYEMALEVSRQLGRDPNKVLIAKTSDQIPPKCFKSPLDISMDSSRLSEVFGINPKSFAEAVSISLKK